MRLDILIPVYEPHPDWATELVDQFIVLKSRLDPNLEIKMIIVNDGSTRSLNTEADYITRALPEASYHAYEVNRGKGYALRQAAMKSDAPLVMYTDYDFPYTYGSMVSMVEMLQSKEVDAVVGKRDDSYYAHISPRRRRISKFLKNFNRMVFRLPTDDTQCGLKAFNAKAREIFLETETDRYLIDVEFLKKLSKNKAKVGVQLVKLREGVVLSKISNLSLFKEMINYLKIMISS